MTHPEHAPDAAKRPHPYRGMPDYRHWKRAPGVMGDFAALDPVVAPKFRIGRGDKVATTGSCFAQNVARHLKRSGFDILITEPAPLVLDPSLHAQFNYGVYTTRSGNVYTAAQLRQLFERAYGLCDVSVAGWQADDGWIDPFRPNVATFDSEAELLADRAHHLARVRQMVETMDVFVMTVGMTEAWSDPEGAVFPIAPGVAGGAYDPEHHSLRAFTVEETTADLDVAVRLIADQNPAARVVLTVSPQPILATGLDRHILVSSTHTKAILRVACQAIADRFGHVDYFPSYEIVTAPQSRGRYFAADARSVTEAGVAHVMRVFLAHYSAANAPAKREAQPHEHSAERAAREHERAMTEVADAVCDEEVLADVR